MNAKILNIEEIKEKLSNLHPKFNFRVIAEKSGWNLPKYSFIEIPIKDFHQENLSNIDFTIFNTNLLHVLLIKPEFIRNRIMRDFISIECITFQLSKFVRDITTDLQEKSNIIILLTEVIEAKISGISFYSDNYCLLEFGFGQMIAKGTNKLSKILLKEGNIIKTNLIEQDTSIVINLNRKEVMNCNATPNIEDSIVKKIYKLSEKFHKISTTDYSIEWLIDNKNEIYFLDANLENISNFQEFLRPSFLEHNIKSITISEGVCEGPVKIIVDNNSENSLDKHFLEQIPSNEIIKEYIIVAKRPYLSLSKYIPRAIGFIFKEGSILCHLSNQIRTLGLPAIINKEIFEKINNENLKTFKLDYRTASSLSDKNGFFNSKKYNEKLTQTNLTITTYPEIKEDEKSDIVYNIGGKAANLNLLYNLDYKIPKTIILSYKLFTDLVELTDENISNIIESIDFSIIYAENGEKTPLICRSSANLEDHISNSMAGIFKSFGDIKGRKNLIQAIKNILRFKEDLQIQSNLENYEIIPDNILMSIVIQEWISPVIGGVLFTRSPINFRNDELIIEYDYNNSEGITSGQAKPNRIIFSRNDVQNRKFLKKRFNNYNIKGVIEFNEFWQFLKDCIRLEEVLSYPLDIEFLINQKGSFIYTQVRPISRR